VRQDKIRLLLLLLIYFPRTQGTVVTAVVGVGCIIDLRKPMSEYIRRVVLRKFYFTVSFNSNATRDCIVHIIILVIFVMDSETSVVGRGPTYFNNKTVVCNIVVTRNLFSFLTDFT